jgi:hypothetical protein
MKIEVDLLPPLMPNFVSAKSEPRKRQDGFSQPLIYDIADFTREEAEQYADLMRDAFMKHWEQRKAQKKISPQADNSQEK